MTKSLKIAVGIPDNHWHDKFVAALDRKIAAGYPLQYETLDFARHDWLEAVTSFDIEAWRVRTTA